MYTPHHTPQHPLVATYPCLPFGHIQDTATVWLKWEVVLLTFWLLTLTTVKSPVIVMGCFQDFNNKNENKTRTRIEEEQEAIMRTLPITSAVWRNSNERRHHEIISIISVTKGNSCSEWEIKTFQSTDMRSINTTVHSWHCQHNGYPHTRTHTHTHNS